MSSLYPQTPCGQEPFSLPSGQEPFSLPSGQEQRERFLHAAAAAGATLGEYRHPLSGPFGEALYTDVALLGDPGASRVLVALSGTHGIEGYYGSDCQTAWLEQLAGRDLPADTAVLMIHLINPWGTAWRRRVNEDNLDLNRNYLDFSQALPANPAYAELHPIYACTQLRGPQRDQADALLAARIADHGWQGVMSIVEAGQYSHADGLFYGGAAPSWSNRTLRSIVQTYLAHARVILGFDLHTGAGEYGHPMLLTIAQAAYPALADAQAIYGPWLYTLLTGAGQRSDTGVAATATGYTSQALLEALPDSRLMQLVIECGTYPGPQVHQVLRDDHWLHLHGDPLDRTGAQIKQALLEQFYPADPDWRETAWLRTRQIWERGLRQLAVL
ncbi:DUF2817 domain-containing protein [Pseudomonas sp. HR96]|uniref:DUF2817 domain-containing protein n=1 Tax=Pseudomonas sp. HR96 TaxID=1027966 RepID=UPI002A75C7F9|nr:DUF2817 domain-containing protein [Pseudomonas sp. HR96]WPO97696.1 DUF2817 domain-containing protein [Pseudomonas sp. HR96]